MKEIKSNYIRINLEETKQFGTSCKSPSIFHSTIEGGLRHIRCNPGVSLQPACKWKMQQDPVDAHCKGGIHEIVLHFTFLEVSTLHAQHRLI